MHYMQCFFTRYSVHGWKFEITYQKACQKHERKTINNAHRLIYHSNRSLIMTSNEANYKPTTKNVQTVISMKYDFNETV